LKQDRLYNKEVIYHGRFHIGLISSAQSGSALGSASGWCWSSGSGRYENSHV